MTYTMITDTTALDRLNRGGRGLTHRDHFLQAQLGGQRRLKKDVIADFETYLLARGNDPKTARQTPPRVWKWWADRGAIVELK